MIKEYNGWEIIKMLSEGKLKPHTKIERTRKDGKKDMFVVQGTEKCGYFVRHIKGVFDGQEVSNAYFTTFEGIFVILGVNFEEAFKEYQNGKKIISVESGNSFRDGNCFNSLGMFIHCASFLETEIKGLWIVE